MLRLNPKNARTCNAPGPLSGRPCSRPQEHPGHHCGCGMHGHEFRTERVKPVMKTKKASR